MIKLQHGAIARFDGLGISIEVRKDQFAHERQTPPFSVWTRSVKRNFDFNFDAKKEEVAIARAGDLVLAEIGYRICLSDRKHVQVPSISVGRDGDLVAATWVSPGGQTEIWKIHRGEYRIAWKRRGPSSGYYFGEEFTDPEAAFRYLAGRIHKGGGHPTINGGLKS